jgi:hypothetical protein
LNDERKQQIRDAYRNVKSSKFASVGGLSRSSGSGRNVLSDNFTKEDIQKWFTDPDTYSKELRDLSRYLYVSKGIYYTAINFYTNLPTLDYNIIPNFYDFSEGNKDGIMKSKQTVSDYCNDILDKSSVRSIIKAVLKDSTYYGYERKSGKSYYMQRLLNDYCKEGSLINGLPSIKFDFKFFDGQEDKLDGYDNEFRTKYNAFKNSKKDDLRWQTLEHTKTICIPLESDDFNFPALTGIFDDLMDLDDYYKYMKDTIEMETEKVVVQKPPMNEETGEMLVEPEDVYFFQDALANVFDERYKVVSTPFDIDTIDFTKNKMSNSGFDGVDKMKNAAWNGTGIAKPVFGETDSASGLKVNYEINASYIFSIIEKIEKWLKQRLKTIGTKKYSFKVEFLRTTNVYRKDTFDMHFKMFSVGGALEPLISSMGMNPDSYIKLLQMENLEGVKDHLRIPESIYTQSGDSTDEGGAPSSGDDEISDTGERTRDTDGNDR